MVREQATWLVPLRGLTVAGQRRNLTGLRSCAPFSGGLHRRPASAGLTAEDSRSQPTVDSPAMRIAINATGSQARRAAQALLTDARVAALGSVGGTLRLSDKRVLPVEDLSEWDVLLTDAADPDEAAAIEAGIPLVASTLIGTSSGLTGAQPHLALLRALALGQTTGPVTVAWTEKGDRLRDGRVLHFPKPAGTARGEEAKWPYRDDRIVEAFRAPIDGSFSGLLVISQDRTVAVADDTAFLGGIALAAAAVSVVESGSQPPTANYLANAQRFGLVLAETD